MARDIEQSLCEGQSGHKVFWHDAVALQVKFSNVITVYCYLTLGTFKSVHRRTSFSMYVGQLMALSSLLVAVVFLFWLNHHTNTCVVFLCCLLQFSMMKYQAIKLKSYQQTLSKMTCKILHVSCQM